MSTSHPINPAYLPGAKLMTTAFGGRTSVSAEKIQPWQVTTVDLGAAPATAEPVEHEQDWYFTFGAGHRAHALLHHDRIVTEELGDGFRLDNRYVILHGTYDEARRRMEKIFGLVWSAVYPNAEEAGVEEYGLTELVIA